MLTKIMFATDGSAHSEKSLEYTKTIAQKLGAKVLVFHACPPMPGYIELLPYDEPYQEAVAKGMEYGREIVDKAAEMLNQAGVSTETEVVEGSAAQAILDMAEKLGVDLIVVGAKGEAEVAGVLMGSVSHRVVTHAKVPVLVVH
jgi:nucleotide-binding universal stress UspA family protein